MCLLQELFSSPLPTPSMAGSKVESLVRLQSDLESKVAAEREALHSVRLRLPVARAGAVVELRAEEVKRLARLEQLELTIQRTQSTREALQQAQADLDASTSHVKAAERRLQDSAALGKVSLDIHGRARAAPACPLLISSNCLVSLTTAVPFCCLQSKAKSKFDREKLRSELQAANDLMSQVISHSALGASPGPCI